MPWRGPWWNDVRTRKQDLEDMRAELEAERAAVDEAFGLLAEHVTNASDPALHSGQRGYDPQARYAYLVLRDRRLSRRGR